MNFICAFLLSLSFTSLALAESPVALVRLLQPFVDKHELAGAVVLVADKDRIVATQSIGFANMTETKPMRKDSLFWIASQTKGMTATAVLMLFDEGRISLDDAVEKYLPEFRGQMVVAEKDDAHTLLRKPAHPITIREVLSHMSGLPFKSAIEEPTLDGLTLETAVRSYAMTPLQTEPGTHYQYSNAGINTAARIIEVVTGTKYEDFMQTRLFDPLGMTDTTFWPNEEQVSRLARSYRPDDAKTNLVEFPLSQLRSPLTDHEHRFPMPAGGLFSTAKDTAIFCQMLLRGGELGGKRYLSEASMNELKKRQTPGSVNDSYSLGFAVGPDWIGHGGAQATNMEIHFGKGLVTIWMVQHGGYPGDGGKAHGAFKQWAYTGNIAPIVGARAHPSPSESLTESAILTFTAQEDHQEMMAQLGITQLRPGPSGNPDSENAANYDESVANPFHDWPELLTAVDGSSIDDADAWRNKRRPEIVEAFSREVYGRVPANVPDVAWSIKESREAKVGDIDVVEQHVIGSVNHSACPEIEVQISMSLTLPKGSTGSVPVLMMFGRTPFDPTPEWMKRFMQNQNGDNASRPRGPSPEDELIAAGWGVAKINPASIQADNGAGLTRGIIGLVNLGQPRKPDDWGALRAWAWGASRGLDYLQTRAEVNAQRIGIEGVSRYGKAALVTIAMDQRFAMVLVGSSGAGGATPHRRHFGEAVENLAGSGEYHWMAGNVLKYATKESSFGSMNAGDLPVESHQLIALCAPRLTFISYGIPEKGDANWLDQRGSFMATVAASKAFELLGDRGLGIQGDYKTATMPPVNEGLLDGRLAWRQHDGGHTDAPNIGYFIRWCETHFED